MDSRQFASLEDYVEAHRAQTRKKQSEAKQGEKSTTAVLTAKQVIEIRRKYIPGVYGSKKLGQEYGVFFTTIQSIVNGKTWTHVPMGDHNSLEDYVAAKKAEAAALQYGHSNAKLTNDKVREIRRRFMVGAKKQELAKEYGVHYKTISDILINKIWKDI